MKSLQAQVCQPTRSPYEKIGVNGALPHSGHYRMTFIRHKTDRHGTRFYSICEAYRDDHGRPRQRRLVYLGKYPTLDEAIDGVADESVDRKGIAERRRRSYRKMEKMVAELYPGRRHARSPIMDQALGECEQAEAAYDATMARLGKLVRFRDDPRARGKANPTAKAVAHG